MREPKKYKIETEKGAGVYVTIPHDLKEHDYLIYEYEISIPERTLCFIGREFSPLDFCIYALFHSPELIGLEEETSVDSLTKTISAYIRADKREVRRSILHIIKYFQGGEKYFEFLANVGRG